MPESKEKRPTHMPKKRRGFNFEEWVNRFDENAPGGDIRIGNQPDGTANHHPGINVRDLPSK